MQLRLFSYLKMVNSLQSQHNFFIMQNRSLKKRIFAKKQTEGDYFFIVLDDSVLEYSVVCFFVLY